MSCSVPGSSCANEIHLPSGDQPWRVGDLPRDGDRLRDRQRPPRDHLRQVLALDQLHHQRAATVALLETVDGGDVRVVELRQELRLALEARQPVGVGGERRREHLDRHLAPQRGVGGAIRPRPCRPHRAWP
jgi:hypothetical protein